MACWCSAKATSSTIRSLTFITAEAPESAVKPLQTTDVVREGDGVLAFGGLLPQTGSLAFLGAAGVRWR